MLTSNCRWCRILVVAIHHAKVGAVITCEANTEGITDHRYHWYANGYPLTYGASHTYKITRKSSGANIRCIVKALGA